ncbi:hypothetical protein B7P43_G05662 [Cryptotermes secundus]|uniref:Golgin subfamily B member 1 n=1 Tax=Cryptotermes secundus TaxID=105785 RepID=A0A2J7RFT8_9NEOP|nr:protein lava lamp isoform X2 [Cryptotermes secundus]PNF39690.1 hypothetical protein B7P43_G05662 [Cryptotermes secundus]
MSWSPGGDTGEEPPPSYQEEGDMKDQFQQQQEKIAELKELLKQNEEKLMNKEKEVEQYATKLSDIKSRSKASKRKSVVQKQDSPEQVEDLETPKKGSHKEEVSTPVRKSTEKVPKGNLVLLRKKLEENRLKFEQRGKEINESKKGIEEMVQHLKTQLDERDVTIQELQKGLQHHQSPAKLTELQEMKENVNSSVESSGQTPEEISTQTANRDNKITELNNRIAELETTILDLQENFREKDSVIDARTKAITLMSEDFSRRNKITLDNLEETREEMRKMQSNFVTQEGKMKEENERLKEELAAKDHRLHHLEDSVKSLESIRFDLSTRNAGLQEKVVKVQEQLKGLQERPPEEQDHTRVEDLTRQLDDANKQIMKLKAQQKTKVKNLNKQLDELRKMSDASEEIMKLQNRVAELEEDKVSEAHWRTRVLELEERVLQQSQDLDSHVHMIALLEAEKLDNMQVIHFEKEKVSSLETEIESLRSSLQDLENQKVSLEMKTVDLEEQIDTLIKEKAELIEEVEMMSHERQGLAAEHPIARNRENNSDTKKLFQSVELVEGQEEEKQLPADTGETETMNKSLQQLKVELLSTNKVIEEQKEIIMNLKCKIDSRDEELEMQNEIIKKLEHLSGDYNDRDDRIAEIVKELSEMAGDLEEWKTRCTEVEKRLQDLGNEKMELEERFKEIKSENSVLNEELTKQREVANDLASKLKEQSNAITGRDERISSLQGLIEQNGQTLEAREMTLKDVHEKLNNVEKQYELRLSELKLTLANKERELLDMTSALMQQEIILKDKETDITELSETLQKQSHEFAYLQQHLSTVEKNVFLQFRAQLDEMSVTLAEKDQLNHQLVEECQKYRQQIESLTTELSDKVQVIARLETQTEKFKEVELQFQSAVSNLKSCEEELSNLKQELVLKQSEVEEKTDKLKQVEGRVTELIEKNKKFIANLKAKAVALKGHEQKLQQYEAVVQAKEKLISELTAENEELLKRQADKTDLEQQVNTIAILTKEVNEERSRTELIGDELAKATEKIVSLERELKLSGFKLDEMNLMKDTYEAMTNKVSELEHEINTIQMELRNSADRIMLLEKDNIRLTEERKAKEQQEEKKSSLLQDKIKELKAELLKQTEELEKLKAEKNELLQQVLSSSDSIAKASELEEQVRIRDQRLAEFEEQLMSSFELNKQSLSAVEAKLQEREAVVESLEQELSKATERVEHLEEGLAFAEERCQSLESKVEALSIRLQESDRVKEEVVESEEMLEQRLTVLIGSEESLKRKLEVLSVENEELTLRIAELTKENGGLQKEIMNIESTVKELQKELERLSPFEYSFVQASEKAEALQAELKRAITELEHRMKEKVQEVQQHAENLETDLRNVNVQLEHAELEKRTLIEQYEKLNDVKVRLEDEVERLSHILEVHKQAISDLKKELQEKLFIFETTISEKEVARKELEERVQMLETELQEKMSGYEEKERAASDMNVKIHLLEEELKVMTSAVDTATSEKEEIKNKLNERIALLEKELEGAVLSFESASSEKEKVHCELQEVLQFQEAELKRYQHMLEVMQSPTETDSNVSRVDSEEQVASLTAELGHLKSVLTQKVNEIKSYQTRLLQLQFKNVPDDEHDDHPYLQAKVSHLEDSNIKLLEIIHIKEVQISDLSTAVAASSTELGQLRSELKSYHHRVEELTKQVNILQQEAMNKNNYIQQLQMTLAETEVQFPSQVESATQESRLKLSALEKQNKELFKELLKVKAQHTVADIVRVAEEHVQNMSTALEDPDHGHKSVTLQQTVQEQSDSFGTEDRIKELEEELQLIQSERDEALLKITELASKIPPTSGDTVLIFEHNALVKGSTEVSTPWQQMNISQNLRKIEPSVAQDSSVAVAPQDVAPETVLNLSSSNWDMGIEGEEEGWGWGSDEARLEEEHIRKQHETVLYSEPSDVLNDRIVTLENHIKDVIAEKEKLSEELHAAQVRSGKMLKKLKDLKLKNDSLLKENIELAKKSGDKNFGDLDQAIEEELKIHIDNLEKELEEVRNEKDSACGEKERLESHIDMLTCANDRLVEMKERQDIDIEMWKQRNRDLSNEVQSLEWRIGELMEENKSVTESSTQGNHSERESFFSWDKHAFTSNSRSFMDTESTNNELQEQLAALSADNENLQRLIEEQRNLRLAAEVELQKIQQRKSQTDTEMQFCSEEGSNVKEHSDVVTEYKTVEELKQECDRLMEEKNNFQNAYHALKTEYDRMCTESEQYVVATEKKYEAVQFEYTKKIEDVCDEKIKIEEYYRNVLKERDLLAEELQQLSTNLADLTQKHKTLEQEYSNIKEHLTMQEKALSFENEQKCGLERELAHLISQMESNSLGLTDTSELLHKQQMRISELEMELQGKTEEIEKLRQLIENQKLEQAQGEQEWNSKLEHCRKELELCTEELHKQQNHHSILLKECQELRDHNDEMIRCHVLEALNAKEKEIGKLKVYLAEKEAVVLELEQRTKENQRVNESLDLLSARDKDIESLKTRLTQKEKEIEELYSIRDKDMDNLKIMLSEKEQKFEELLGQKDHDIYNLQVQLSEKDARISELQQTLDEEARQLTELRTLLEDRELQLKQLKDELMTTRSKEEQDLSVLPNQPHDSFSSSLTDEIKPSVQDSPERRGRKDSSSSDAQQGELDLALYMLHQRDVRCDELTLELMQLLEERDSLQLRLSNALRMNEELRARIRTSVTSSPDKTADQSQSREQVPQHIAAAVSLPPSVSAAMQEPQEDLQILANKLSQLHSVGYHRDVTLQDEREQRHSEQMRMLHPRGSGIVVDASYTLSRDVQSPSTVLLNWIWGRSTPRVMHV